MESWYTVNSVNEIQEWKNNTEKFVSIIIIVESVYNSINLLYFG